MFVAVLPSNYLKINLKKNNMNTEAKDIEKTTYPESGLTDYELEIEQLVDKIKSTDRTLDCIVLVRSFIEQKSVGNNADLESVKCNKQSVIARFKSLQRFDLDSCDNGEFIESERRYEEDGQFIDALDLEQIINDLESNAL